MTEPASPAEERPSRRAANALLDAVEEAVQSEALPGNIHRRLSEAFNEVVDQANKAELAKHGLVLRALSASPAEERPLTTTPAFTYWTTDRGTRNEQRWRRCTTCGQPEPLGREPNRDGCPYKALHRPGKPEYTGRTPSS